MQDEILPRGWFFLKLLVENSWVLSWADEYIWTRPPRLSMAVELEGRNPHKKVGSSFGVLGAKRLSLKCHHMLLWLFDLGIVFERRKQSDDYILVFGEPPPSTLAKGWLTRGLESFLGLGSKIEDRFWPGLCRKLRLKVRLGQPSCVFIRILWGRSRSVSLDKINNLLKNLSSTMTPSLL